MTVACVAEIPSDCSRVTNWAAVEILSRSISSPIRCWRWVLVMNSPLLSNVKRRSSLNDGETLDATRATGRYRAPRS